MDLLREVKSLCKSKGLNPGDYEQTLREANKRRWGASSILRNDGIGIDEVYQEFDAMYPGLFDSLDEFVEALASRLGRKKSIKDEIEMDRDWVIDRDELLIDVQVKNRSNRLNEEVLDDYVIKQGRKLKLSTKGLNRIIEMSLEMKGD